MASEQLSLFPLDWRVVIRLDPQPYRVEKYTAFSGIAYPGDWVWQQSSGHHLIATHPESSTTFRNACPYQVGLGYQDGVIDSVDLCQLSTGWSWILHLRHLADHDIEPYWRNGQARDPLPAKSDPFNMYLD